MKFNFMLNRNALKIIALVTMLIDHVAILIMPYIPMTIYYLMRGIGRISFPLFAFFVAEGFYYTRNRKKYLFTMLFFAFISQIPFYLFFQNLLYFNILFTFTISIVLMHLYDTLFRENNKFNKFLFIIITILVCTFIFILSLLNISVDYSIYGILLTLMFYIFKHSKLKQFIAFIILNLCDMALSVFLYGPMEYFNYITLLALLAIPLIALFNGKKGKLHLKYLFYWFYPIHITIIYIISLFI